MTRKSHKILLRNFDGPVDVVNDVVSVERAHRLHDVYVSTTPGLPPNGVLVYVATNRGIPGLEELTEGDLLPLWVCPLGWLPLEPPFSVDGEWKRMEKQQLPARPVAMVIIEEAETARCELWARVSTPWLADLTLSEVDRQKIVGTGGSMLVARDFADPTGQFKTADRRALWPKAHARIARRGRGKGGRMRS